MTKKEFLKYLYNNNDELNPLLIIEFLFQNFRGLDKENNLALQISKIAELFGIKLQVANYFHDCTGGIIHYNNKAKLITVNGNLEDNKQRYIILILLFELFKKYKETISGYQFTSAFVFNELPNQNKYIISLLEEDRSNVIKFPTEEERSKVIKFPKKY